ncbi:lysophospholiPASe L1 [Terrimicrobium sacchariphilum]|uniref:LysophospholiPASe L1 n=1 Tax=Terrimicrobium sacchariphilum TaxID=690879 RepID=A0A146G6A0_TERSA|nr:SGNH/GDSL hydrolase family protein [Terrimicrobium sacchariphilum]GAT32246.1 lysophospholiPASe L1 [Terrimicrobium sacchariphilum]
MSFAVILAAGVNVGGVAHAADEVVEAVWKQGGQRRGEPVAFVRPTGGGHPVGMLALSGKKVLRIYSGDGSRDYSVSDFQISGNRVEYIGSESLPCLEEAELFPESNNGNAIGWYKDGKKYLLYAPGAFLPERQLCFDYQTDETWSPAPPEDQSALLPKLQEKLKAGKPVSLAILGDSISAGSDAFREPPYFTRLADMLGHKTGSTVSVTNHSKGGESTPYGVAQAASVAAEKPDLVIIGFGMNDGSASLKAEDFSQNIHSIISTIRRDSPETEFVIINGMTPNPDWNLSNPEIRETYPKALQRLKGKGVAVCDVRTTWTFLVDRKGFWSLTGNGVNHPNDFGHKLYADALLSCISGEAAKR